jgi:hypothetical protein
MVYKSRRKIKRSRSKKSRKFRLRSKKMKGGEEDKFTKVNYKDLDRDGTTEYYANIGTYVSNGFPNAVTFADKNNKTTLKNMLIDPIYKRN